MSRPSPRSRTAGRLTGNERLTAEGRAAAEQATGDARQTIEDVFKH
ncbi:CsbD family protein [Streptomyces sp. SP18ES09]|nr:CsbD family protein [Streptomyces sp. SP18ES09]MEE1814450.1 CsbD family protein [Streptomyces sp. SP18ES09]